MQILFPAPISSKNLIHSTAPADTVDNVSKFPFSHRMWHFGSILCPHIFPQFSSSRILGYCMRKLHRRTMKYAPVDRLYGAVRSSNPNRNTSNEKSRQRDAPLSSIYMFLNLLLVPTYVGRRTRWMRNASIGQEREREQRAISDWDYIE